MPYNTQSEQIAFFNGCMPILRYLPMDGHPRREMLGNTSEIYEAKQVERENLLRCMAEWVDKLSKQPKCVWESNKQHETLKELKRFKRNPEVAVPELKKSSHGCLYLLQQWDYLKRVVDADSFCGDFKTSDETLLLGLCEVPFWNRDQNFDFMPSDEMTPEEAHAHIRPFIQEKIDSLRVLSLALRAKEEREWEIAIAAPEFFPDKDLRRWKKDLHKLERELVAIFTYVQSLLTPEQKPVEASMGEALVTVEASLKNVEPPTAQIASLTVQNPAHSAPVLRPLSPAPKPEISKPVEVNRPTAPVQTKPAGSLSRSQARKIRRQEAAEHKRQRMRSDILEQNREQSNILPIWIGKRGF